MDKLTFENCERFLLRGGGTLKDGLELLEATGSGFILTKKGDTVGLLTEGDFRRLLLAGVDLKENAFDSCNTTPFVATVTDYFRIESWSEKVRELRVVLVRFENDSSPTKVLYYKPSPPLENVALVLMAGGKGVRLRPLTLETPKPLLLLSGTPIIRKIQDHALQHGIRECHVTVNYLAERFFDQKELLSSGFEDFYIIREPQELGTGGALALVSSEKPFYIVQNADVLSDIDYTQLLEFHVKGSYHVTVVAKRYSWTNPFGVLVTNGAELCKIEEKPTLSFDVSAGIYIFSAASLAAFFQNRSAQEGKVDAPEILKSIMLQGGKIGVYSHDGAWKDIGTLESLEEARNEL